MTAAVTWNAAWCDSPVNMSLVIKKNKYKPKHNMEVKPNVSWNPKEENEVESSKQKLVFVTASKRRMQGETMQRRDQSVLDQCYTSDL